MSALPTPAFVRHVVNGGRESNSSIVISCCARTQREKCRVREISGAVTQRNKPAIYADRSED